MKRIFYKILCMLLLMQLIQSPCFSQDIDINTLNYISYSNLPFCDKKGELFTNFVGLNSPAKISDKLYDDLQCTKFVNAGNSEDLAPALYLKVKVPNSSLILGAITYGGATDYRTDQLFISDLSGNIKSSLEGTVMNSCISIKQYQITKDCKIIISQLVLTSTTPILYEDFIGTNKSIEAYRLDTTYSISSDGKFVKEGEKKYPTKNYTEKQMTDNEIWDL